MAFQKKKKKKTDQSVVRPTGVKKVNIFLIKPSTSYSSLQFNTSGKIHRPEKNLRNKLVCWLEPTTTTMDKLCWKMGNNMKSLL